jgi:MFS family permease
MIAALILVASSYMGDQSTGTGWAVGGLALYMAMFSLGTGPGAWLIPSEIFATSIRAKAMSIATFCNRVTATVMSSTFLTTVDWLGNWGNFFLLLAGISAIVLVFLYYMLPETKGRSLEDMSIYFAEITNDSSLLEAEQKIIQQRGFSVEMTTTPNAATPSAALM